MTKVVKVFERGIQGPQGDQGIQGPQGASPSLSQSLVGFGSANNTVTGSNNFTFSNGNLLVGGSVISNLFTGSFKGNGSQLTNIPSSAIVGLNLNSIVSGSVSASISPNFGLSINSKVIANSFTGSFQGNGSGITNISAGSIVGLNLSRIAVSNTTASVSSGGESFNVVRNNSSLMYISSSGRIGMGTTIPTAKVHIVGSGATSATTALEVSNNSGIDKLVVKDNGAIEIGRNDSGTTQAVGSIQVAGSGSNIGLALVPKGNGAITAQIPDGTTSGGDLRGAHSIDFQMVRISSTQVCRGARSFIGSGERNTIGSANTQAFIGSGFNNNISPSSFPNRNVIVNGGDQTISGVNTSTAFIGNGYGNQISISNGFIGNGTSNTINSQQYGFIGNGISNSVSGQYGFIGNGISNSVSGQYSCIVGGESNIASSIGGIVTGGVSGRSYLVSQRSISSGRFSSIGDAQTSDIRYRNFISGSSIKELFLDGSSSRAVISLPSGANNGRLWNAKIQVVAICRVQGDGTITAGESFIGNYAVGIKRIGTSTSLVGTVQKLHTEQYDTNMSGSLVTISADDTNEALKIEFTPSPSAGSTTVTRVVATAYLTEVGY